MLPRRRSTSPTRPAIAIRAAAGRPPRAVGAHPRRTRGRSPRRDPRRRPRPGVRRTRRGRSGPPAPPPATARAPRPAGTYRARETGRARRASPNRRAVRGPRSRERCSGSDQPAAAASLPRYVRTSPCAQRLERGPRSAITGSRCRPPADRRTSGARRSRPRRRCNPSAGASSRSSPSGSCGRLDRLHVGSRSVRRFDRAPRHRRCRHWSRPPTTPASHAMRSHRSGRARPPPGSRIGVPRSSRMRSSRR